MGPFATAAGVELPVPERPGIADRLRTLIAGRGGMAGPIPGWSRDGLDETEEGDR